MLCVKECMKRLCLKVETFDLNSDVHYSTLEYTTVDFKYEQYLTVHRTYRVVYVQKGPTSKLNCDWKSTQK